MKPTGADLYLLYKCPKCSQEHPVTIKETKFPGGMLCVCGCKIMFDPIEHVHLNIQYQRKTKGTPLDKTKGVVYNQRVVQSLVGLGYKKADVTRVYKEAYATLGNEEEVIVQQLLRLL